MRRTAFLTILCILLTSIIMIGCGGKYGDAKKVNAEFVELTEGYLNDLEKSDNPKDVAKAMNKYADNMEKLWPEMKKMAEKYPELKDRSNIPDELKDSQKQVEEMGKKMSSAFRKIMPHMSDPDVQKAQQRISTVMMGK